MLSPANREPPSYGPEGFEVRSTRGATDEIKYHRPATPVFERIAGREEVKTTSGTKCCVFLGQAAASLLAERLSHKKTIDVYQSFVVDNFVGAEGFEPPTLCL